MAGLIVPQTYSETNDMQAWSRSLVQVSSVEPKSRASPHCGCTSHGPGAVCAMDHTFRAVPDKMASNIGRFVSVEIPSRAHVGRLCNTHLSVRIWHNALCTESCETHCADTANRSEDGDETRLSCRATVRLEAKACAMDSKRTPGLPNLLVL